MEQDNTNKVLDLLPFIAKAMAQNAAARQQLDAVYAEGWLAGEQPAADRRESYNRYYRQSDPLTESYCYKATGLLLTIERDHKNCQRAAAAVEQIIKKCWRSLHAYVQASGPVVMFEPFWRQQVKKAAKAPAKEVRNLPPFSARPDNPFPAPPAGLPPDDLLPAPPADGLPQSLVLPVIWRRGRRPGPAPKKTIRKKSLLDGEFVIFWYLANLLGKRLVDVQSYVFVQHWHAYSKEQERMWMFAAPPLTAAQQALADELWQSVETRLKGIPNSLDQYLQTKHGQGCRYWFAPERLGGLPVDILRQVNVSRKELRQAIDAMAAALPAATAVTAERRQEALDLVFQTLFARACAAEYDKLRQEVQQQPKTDKKAQDKQLKKQLTEAQRQVQAQQRALADRQASLDDLEQRLEKSQQAAQREIARLQEKLAATEAALNGVLASETPASETEAALGPEQLAAVAALRVVILGGRPDWQQRLLQNYPNFTCISSAKMNFDLAVLDSADVVVISWKHLGHSLFYRATQYAAKRGKEIMYISSSNEQQLIKALYRLLPWKEESQEGLS